MTQHSISSCNKNFFKSLLSPIQGSPALETFLGDPQQSLLKELLLGDPQCVVSFIRQQVRKSTMGSSSNDAGDLFGFNDPTHSNWKLKIVVENPSESSLKRKREDQPSNELTESSVLHVSSLVLGKHSNFFRYYIFEILLKILDWP